MPSLPWPCQTWQLNMRPCVLRCVHCSAKVCGVSLSYIVSPSSCHFLCMAPSPHLLTWLLFSSLRSLLTFRIGSRNLQCNVMTEVIERERSGLLGVHTPGGAWRILHVPRHHSCCPGSCCMCAQVLASCSTVLPKLDHGALRWNQGP